MNKDNQKLLKIAMITDLFDGANLGGLVSTRRFVKLLREQHHVTVVAKGKPQPDKVIVPDLSFSILDRYLNKHEITFAKPNKQILTSVIEQSDVVHVQLPFFLSYGAINVAKELGKPVVATIHVQPENLFYALGIKWKPPIAWLYKFFIKHIYSRCDKVICPSQFAMDELIKHGFKRPATVISNGKPDKFIPHAIEKPEHFKDKFIILSVGRLSKDKCQPLIIDAVNQSKYRDKIQLIIVGRGPREKLLKKYASRLPNYPEFTSGLTTQQLVELYNTADLFVHGGLVELEGLSVLEAISCGRTVLISNSPTSAAKQFALDDLSLFQHDDARDLSAKIDYWIDNPEHRKAQGEKYFQHSQQYDIHPSVDKLVDAYRSVLP